MNKLINVFSSILFILLSISCNSQNNSTEKEKETAKIETIAADKILKKIQNNESVFIANSIITGELDFTKCGKNENDEAKGSLRSYISSSVTFSYCTFENKVSGYKNEPDCNHTVTFEKNLTFLNCTFKDEVNFKDCSVNGLTNFSGSTFQKITNFEGAYFTYKDIYFSETTFFDELKCQRIVANGNLSFFKSEFKGITSFQNARFGGDVQFGASKFLQYADFGNIIANAGFYCNYTEFAKAIFNNSTFKQRTEFQYAKFNNYTEFKKSCFYGSTLLNNITINNIFDLENASFYSGKPVSNDIIKNENSQINFKNTTFIESKNLINF